jgi:hypothetical protein
MVGSACGLAGVPGFGATAGARTAPEPQNLRLKRLAQFDAGLNYAFSPKNTLL